MYGCAAYGVVSHILRRVSKESQLSKLTRWLFGMPFL